MPDVSLLLLVVTRARLALRLAQKDVTVAGPEHFSERHGDEGQTSFLMLIISRLCWVQGPETFTLRKNK